MQPFCAHRCSSLLAHPNVRPSVQKSLPLSQRRLHLPPLSSVAYLEAFNASSAWTHGVSINALMTPKALATTWLHFRPSPIPSVALLAIARLPVWRNRFRHSSRLDQLTAPDNCNRKRRGLYHLSIPIAGLAHARASAGQETKHVSSGKDIHVLHGAVADWSGRGLVGCIRCRQP